MENLLFLGVPILKHIRVIGLIWCISSCLFESQVFSSACFFCFLGDDYDCRVRWQRGRLGGSDD